MTEKIYDVIIIGGGPAGLAAGSYAGRSRMSTLIIEKEKIRRSVRLLLLISKIIPAA